MPTFRQHAVESADYLRHFIFSRETFLNEITQSLLVSATSIIQIGWKLSGTRVALNLVMNGVMENRWMAEGRHQMETARAMTLQQSIEMATPNWASTHNRGRCPRCNGLMVDEWCQDLSDYRAQRCVQCGEMIDPVILHNRGALHGPMTTHLAGKMLANNCLTKNQ